MNRTSTSRQKQILIRLVNIYDLLPCKINSEKIAVFSGFILYAQLTVDFITHSRKFLGYSRICPFFKSIAGKKNKKQVFTHELVNDLGKGIKEMVFTRELLDKPG